MDIVALYNYLFDSIEGILWLMAAALVISTLLAIIYEQKLRKRYRDRGFKNPEDDWNNPDNDL